MTSPLKFPTVSPVPEGEHTPVTSPPMSSQERDPVRVDYDLQPLIVRSLEHYLDQQDINDRFHIR